jgi:hypothetical protein
MGLPTLSGLTTSVYGTNSSNAVSYNISEVSSTEQMKESKLLAVAQRACDERVRRGSTTITIPSGYYSGLIYGSRIQDIRTVVEVAGPAATQAYNGAGNGTNSSNGLGSTIIGYRYVIFRGQQPIYGPVDQPEVITYAQAAAPTNSISFSKNDRISAENINTVIREINNAGNACTCNCNYCTCNCNYCTCNCNYSCTCNCNY